jgi:hypothetical protein
LPSLPLSASSLHIALHYSPTIIAAFIKLYVPSTGVSSVDWLFYLIWTVTYEVGKYVLILLATDDFSPLVYIIEKSLNPLNEVHCDKNWTDQISDLLKKSQLTAAVEDSCFY